MICSESLTLPVTTYGPFCMTVTRALLSDLVMAHLSS
jgi:hypothetical protein